MAEQISFSEFSYIDALPNFALDATTIPRDIRSKSPKNNLNYNKSKDVSLVSACTKDFGLILMLNDSK